MPLTVQVLFKYFSISAPSFLPVLSITPTCAIALSFEALINRYRSVKYSLIEQKPNKQKERILKIFHFLSTKLS